VAGSCQARNFRLLTCDDSGAPSSNRSVPCWRSGKLAIKELSRPYFRLFKTSFAVWHTGFCERKGLTHTFQSTALVHEAYLRLVNEGGGRFVEQRALLRYLCSAHAADFGRVRAFAAPRKEGGGLHRRRPPYRACHNAGSQERERKLVNGDAVFGEGLFGVPAFVSRQKRQRQPS
jgi:hypothetical protein